MDAQGSPAPRAGHLGDVAVREAARVCIDPMQFDRRFRAMTGQTHRFSGAGHGVPLVAHPPGVQQQRSFSRRGMDGRARRHRNEARATEMGLYPLATKFPNIGTWVERVEALPGYDKTFPPHWR